MLSMVIADVLLWNYGCGEKLSGCSYCTGITRLFRLVLSFRLFVCLTIVMRERYEIELCVAFEFFAVIQFLENVISVDFNHNAVRKRFGFSDSCVSVYGSMKKSFLIVI